jgi:hypothetical protein
MVLRAAGRLGEAARPPAPPGWWLRWQEACEGQLGRMPAELLVKVMWEVRWVAASVPACRRPCCMHEAASGAAPRSRAAGE